MFGLVPFASKNNLAKKEDAFGRLFDIFNEPFFNSPMTSMHEWMSGMGSFKVDVKDNGSSYQLVADLPGVKKEDVFLDYENGYLTIQAKSDQEKEEKDEANKYVCRERYIGNVSRSFYIGDIDKEKVNAEFRDGILTIDMPKVYDVNKTKQIEIH
ncbi:Hsp20/alpha crystallin family protein [Propionispira raffinosivorans]|uniref:Hsp20/alpha crystallin family protein n=1 Tax=Propionispira raffinosivorans TaxID=86959 RepID=UPI000377CF5A|nr:Hsp20/alpha crystallin family protein [Propionispira raffinosivorans]